MIRMTNAIRSSKFWCYRKQYKKSRFKRKAERKEYRDTKLWMDIINNTSKGKEYVSNG